MHRSRRKLTGQRPDDGYFRTAAQLADLIVKGEAFSETAGRTGNIVTVKARVEIKVVDRKTDKVVAVERQVAVVADLAELSAGKAALQEAAAIIAERLIPKLVKE